MSQENVELIRRQVERFLTTGQLSLHEAVEDMPWHDPPDFPDAQVHYGEEGVRNAIVTWASAWDEWEVELQEYVDAGDRVLVTGRQRGRGKDTGALVEQPLALVYLVKDGVVQEVRAFFDIDQARRAASLG